MENMDPFIFKAPRLSRGAPEPKMTMLLVHTVIEEAMNNFSAQLTKYLKDNLHELLGNIAVDMDNLRARVETIEQKIEAIPEVDELIAKLRALEEKLTAFNNL
jgi:hypothetical protein